MLRSAVTLLISCTAFVGTAVGAHANSLGCMLRFAVTLLIFCTAFIGTVVGVHANTLGCGGNSASFAEVVPQHRGQPRKGPIQVLPDSLCADLLEDRRRDIDSLHLSLDAPAEPSPRDRPQRPR